MVLYPGYKSDIFLGTVKVERQKSINERLAKKKYMGECKLLLKVTVNTTRKFPKTTLT